MRIEKKKLPKGTSYPVRSSVLAASFEKAGITIDTHLIYGSVSCLMDVNFWPPNENIPYERIYIQVGQVPSNVVASVRKYVEECTIPELVRWIAEILALPTGSTIRREKQYFFRQIPKV